MQEKECIVSIWANGLPNVGDYIGCGVCISETHILTAKHVIAGLDKSKITIGAIPNRDKGLLLSDIFLHPEKDIAVLQLNHPHTKDVVSCSMESLSNLKGDIQLLTYHQADGGCKRRENLSLTNATREGGWEISHVPNSGESGGGVFLDGRLIAILRAKDESEKTGLIVSLFEVSDFLKEFVFSYAKNTIQKNVISDEDLTRIQIKAIAKELNYEDARAVKKAVATHFAGQTSQESDGQALAKLMVDFYKKNGRVPLLNSLIALTKELIENGCSPLVCRHLDQLFSYILLLTTPLTELQKCNKQADEVIHLSVRTPAAVEVYLSRLFKTAPQFQSQNDQ